MFLFILQLSDLWHSVLFQKTRLMMQHVMQISELLGGSFCLCTHLSVFLLQQLFKENLISPSLAEALGITDQLQHFDVFQNLKISGSCSK